MFTGTVIAVDQSLANTGIVVLSFDHEGFSVGERTTLRSTTSVDGIERCLLRAEELRTEMEEYIRTLPKPDMVVHELPGASNRLQRPESSLLAALALRTVAGALKYPVAAVSANTAKKFLTGNGNAQKRQVKEHLLICYPHLQPLRLNEHLIDAIAVGVTYAGMKK